MKVSFVIVSILTSIFTFSQKEYPKNDFIAPLDIPLHMSGTFGELRGNHFHSGIDFKTQKKEGQNVLAVADGYVSRIKVSPFGYGKALYITHPNGYTTVYGHLQKYAPEIEKYVKKRQYEKESFEVEFFPGSYELKVKQGQLVAFSGNSGSSGGPHLHFEVRDTKTESIINPFFFGYDKIVKDTKKPAINNIYVYPIGEQSHVNKAEIPTIISIRSQKNGDYIANTVSANGKIGFGIEVYDTADFNHNKNGVFKIETTLNGNKNFSVVFNEFAFSESRYINAFLDYQKWAEQKIRVQKMFVENKYSLSLISSNEKNGIIEVLPNISYTYKIEISDFHQNKTTIIIPIEYTAELPTIKKQSTKTNYFLKSKIENIYEKENVSVYVPANVFYNDFNLDFDVKNEIITFANSTIPVHKNYTITIKNTDIPTELREKTYIARLDGTIKKYNKTQVSPNSFKANVRETGNFALAQDTIPPIVEPINFSEGKWISNEKELKISIKDSDSGINTYNAYLNNKWILMEYDYKTHLLIHDFSDQKANEGRNDLKIIVTDNLGNSTTFETHFFRTQKTN